MLLYVNLCVLKHIEFIGLLDMLLLIRRFLDRIKILLVFLQHKRNVIVPFLLLLLQRIVEWVFLHFANLHQLATRQCRSAVHRLEDFFAFQNPLIIRFRNLLLLVSHFGCHLVFFYLFLYFFHLRLHIIQRLSVFNCFFSSKHWLQHFDDDWLFVLVRCFAVLAILKLLLLLVD